MNFTHRVVHSSIAKAASAVAKSFLLPQQYLTHEDLAKEGKEVTQAQASAAASADLKITLYDKHALKKALYGAIMKKLVVPGSD